MVVAVTNESIISFSFSRSQFSVDFSFFLFSLLIIPFKNHPWERITRRFPFITWLIIISLTLFRHCTMVRNYSFAKVSFKTYPAIGCNIDDFDSAVPGSSKQGCASRRYYYYFLMGIFISVQRQENICYCPCYDLLDCCWMFLLLLLSR